MSNEEQNVKVLAGILVAVSLLLLYCWSNVRQKSYMSTKAPSFDAFNRGYSLEDTNQAAAHKLLRETKPSHEQPVSLFDRVDEGNFRVQPNSAGMTSWTDTRRKIDAEFASGDPSEWSTGSYDAVANIDSASLLFDNNGRNLENDFDDVRRSSQGTSLKGEILTPMLRGGVLESAHKSVSSSVMNMTNYAPDFAPQPTRIYV